MWAGIAVPRADEDIHLKPHMNYDDGVRRFDLVTALSGTRDNETTTEQQTLTQDGAARRVLVVLRPLVVGNKKRTRFGARLGATSYT